MKRVAFIFVVIVTTIWATACGGSAPTATQAASQPAATESPTLQSNPTEAGTVDAGTQVDITLADNTVDASQTTFQAGVPYTFVITNTGRRAHNFNINPPVSVAGSLDAALDNALLVVRQEELAPGASVTVEYTFPESAAGQPLEFSCLIRRHYEDEMFLAITVTK